MNLKDMIGNGRIKEVLDELRELHPNNQEVILLRGRYTDLRKQEMLGAIDYKDKVIENNKLNVAIMNLIDTLESSNTTQMESTVEMYLKGLVQDTKLQRLKPELYNKAQELLRQFREYDDKKNAPGSVYDSSGRIKDMLNQAYQNLKTELSETNEDGEEDFEALRFW